jgi:hypothetical protein
MRYSRLPRSMLLLPDKLHNKDPFELGTKHSLEYWLLCVNFNRLFGRNLKKNRNRQYIQIYVAYIKKWILLNMVFP